MRAPLRILLCAAVATCGMGEEVAKPSSAGEEKSEVPRWTEEKHRYSCTLPEGWVFKTQSGNTAIFQEEDKTPPAFINVTYEPAASLPKEAVKDLKAFATYRLKHLTVTSQDEASCRFQEWEAIRASGPVKLAEGRLLDLLLFFKTKDHFCTVMLTCLPEDRKVYEPVFEDFLRGLTLTGPESKQSKRKK
jgi:hypothetical protein